ncbi:alanine:cation symporter family protein [Peribacillus frigoritolerans]|uniref:alanine:cation symporter family protein n=1 Tax=Peribacillus frigoritolerans TaxID=450367 RepID=UPI003F52A539
MNYYLVQANTITSAFNELFGIEKWVTAIILVIVTAVIIFGGIKMIAKASVVIVPIMAGIRVSRVDYYRHECYRVTGCFVLIFESAFGLREVAGGALGAAMLQGIKRGYF